MLGFDAVDPCLVGDEILEDQQRVPIQLGIQNM